MDQGTASVVRTTIKCAAVIVLLNGWPKIRKSHVFNQTVIQPSQADDLIMRSVILELSPVQPDVRYVYFQRVANIGVTENVRTDEYVMLRSFWEEDGKPDSISITVSNLVPGASV